MRAFQSVRPSAWKWAVLSVGVLLLGATARADRLPLPPAEQAEVNRTIDRGVQSLKKSQLSSGSWTDKGANQVAYAALPALTLLECGVVADDPVIKRAARFVRDSSDTTDHTYDLALSILFLDRLGDPKDEKRVQMLAARLLAGQSPTGGWGYRCPNLSPSTTHELLVFLRKIAPGPSPVPMEGGPALVGMPAANPGPAAVPAANPGAALVGRPAVNGPGLTGVAAAPADSPGLTGASVKSPGESANAPGAVPALSADAPASMLGVRALEGPGESFDSRRWNWCIKSEEEPPDAAAPEHAKPQGPAAPLRRLVIPPELTRLAILQDFTKIQMADPKDKGDEIINATTDNSNTQFAILALWVAQRHDVPMERTLRLMTNRFQTGQNADGSWSYHYAFGGGEPEGPPMDCVGLLGLAVGHGLDLAGQAPANNGPDPRILNGFVALSKFVGVPAGRTRDLPIVNMYLLWSIERVAVLYDLPTIADKDWYRWGAEVLVANQSDKGDWPGDGAYPGQTPTANDCLALLFLRRANLVSDLTAVLAIKPDVLNKNIADKLKTPETKPAEVVPVPVAKPTPPPEPPTPTPLEGKPTLPPAPTPVVSAPPPAVTPADAGARASDGGGMVWVVLGIVALALLLLAASGAVLFLHFRNKNKTSKRAKKGRRKKPGGNGDGEKPVGPEPKKPTGKTRLNA